MMSPMSGELWHFLPMKEPLAHGRLLRGSNSFLFFKCLQCPLFVLEKVVGFCGGFGVNVWSNCKALFGLLRIIVCFGMFWGVLEKILEHFAGFGKILGVLCFLFGLVF